MVMISCTLLINAVIPKVISNEMAATAINLEFSLSHCRIAICVSNVKTGAAIGTDRMYAIANAPLMIPAKNATTIAIL